MMKNQNCQIDKEKQEQQEEAIRECSQSSDYIGNNVTIVQNKQIQQEQKWRTIDLERYNELRISKVDQKELSLPQHLVRKQSQKVEQEDQKDQDECHDQRLSTNLMANQECDALNQNSRNEHEDINNSRHDENNHDANQKQQEENVQQQIKFDRSFSTIQYQSSLDREQFEQFVRDVNDPNDDEDEDNNQNQQQVNANELQQYQNLMVYQHDHQNDLRINVNKSIKYISQIFRLQYVLSIVSIVIVLTILIIQTSLTIDQNCNLKEMYEKEEYKNLDNKCPLVSYVVINIRHLFIMKIFYCAFFTMLMSTSQIAQRKLVQYVFVVLLIIYMIYKCAYYGLNKYTAVNELMFAMIVGFVFQSYFNKHSVGVMAYRVCQIVFFITMLGLALAMNIQIRDSRDVYASMIIQHVTFIIKKVCSIYIHYRIENNLWYDDIALYYIGTVNLEYLFIFDYLLIQDNSLLQQLIAVFNFIIIQTYNIHNVSLFYQFLQYLKNKSLEYLKKTVMFQYLLVVVVSAIHIFQIVTTNFYISVVLGLFFKIIQQAKDSDSQITKDKQLQAARSNKYFEQKIDQQDIKHFFTQQTILSYFIFLGYQVLLIIVKVVFPESGSTLNQYQFIYQFKKLSNNNLTLFNVIIFNLGLVLLIFGLIVKKSQKGLKVVKQPTQYQPLITNVIINVGFMSALNRGLFETSYMKLQYIL